ncbi:MAG: C45 family autoproteolytic acyltransferase/hydrolase [Novipirellula sp. JB048]
MKTLLTRVVALLLVCLSGTPVQAEMDAPQLGRLLQPLLACLSGQTEAFSVTAELDVLVDGETQHVDGRLVRYDAHSFDLDLLHRDYSVRIRRRPEATALAVPHHKTVFLGTGDVDPTDHLSPLGISARLIGAGSSVATYLPMLQQADTTVVAQVLTGLLKMNYQASSERWSIGDDLTLRFFDQGRRLEVQLRDQHRVQLATEATLPSPLAVDDWDGFAQVAVERRELEQTVARGVRRALEIAAPSPLLTSPSQTPRRVAHGELRWIDGHRVALLRGTPEQVGFAHGQLLAEESRRCIDSVLHTFGTVNTIRSGKWFRYELDAAYQQLAPHIPDDHKRETLAFAEAMNLEPGTAHAINVFPELFHCSGFALFGDATRDGKLYHGRVLDYMTTIGLQDAATTFIVAIDGKHAFGNIGYAGFIGSVSGMNDQAISLGEMGGGGEGLWDGVPMATLMRRALEECSTLEEVMALWENNPRTCEYYYVFADGKTNRAIGVAAMPESVEFIMPGQTHQRLGEGIADAVVLSSGTRLQTLRERVQQRYGEIDVEGAKWLMSRPVAMSSNLHNVLFVPEEGLFYVANATHREIAANRPYVKIDLTSLLRELAAPPPPEAQPLAEPLAP